MPRHLEAPARIREKGRQPLAGRCHAATVVRPVPGSLRGRDDRVHHRRPATGTGRRSGGGYPDRRPVDLRLCGRCGDWRAAARPRRRRPAAAAAASGPDGGVHRRQHAVRDCRQLLAPDGRPAGHLGQSRSLFRRRPDCRHAPGSAGAASGGSLAGDQRLHRGQCPWRANRHRDRPRLRLAHDLLGDCRDRRSCCNRAGRAHSRRSAGREPAPVGPDRRAQGGLPRAGVCSPTR